MAAGLVDREIVTEMYAALVRAEGEARKQIKDTQDLIECVIALALQPPAAKKYSWREEGRIFVRKGLLDSARAASSTKSR